MTMTTDPLDVYIADEVKLTDDWQREQLETITVTNDIRARAFLDNWDPKFMPARQADGTVVCPHCGRITNSQGFAPHWKSHRAEAERTLGLPVTPSRGGRKPKPEPKHREPKPVAVIEVPVVSVAEALASALAYALGERKLTVEQALDVHDWLVASEQFINSIRD